MKVTFRSVKKDQVRLVVNNLLLDYYEKLYYLPLFILEQLYDMEMQLEDMMTKKEKNLPA